MADIDKAIVSNWALKTKYRTNGFTAIKAAVDKLIAADAQRHIKSKLIFIDDAAAMTKLGGTLPVNPTDQRGAKKAVDAIVASLAPDYAVLLDGPDVIPHIVLDNPVPNDLDDTVDSDLPYASDIGFSNQASRYLKITRVVGRIPNVPNAKEPDKLIALIGSKMEVFTVKGPANYRKAMKALGDADEHVVVMSRTIEAPSEIVAIRHLVAHIVGDGITKVSETVSREIDAKTITVEGEVRHEVVAPGSKSERKAVVLIMPSGKKYVLQREAGNPFADPTLDKLVGHSVKAEGLATSGVLIMRNWKTTD